MIWFEGYPRAQGVTDFADSAVLAGLLSLVRYPNFIMPSYFDEYGNPVRCPISNIIDDQCGNPVTFSRDQMIPLIAGYFIQQNWNGRNKIDQSIKFHRGLCPNLDILSPSQRGHVNICMERSLTWLQDKWIYLDIFYSAWVQPMAEPNQLIAMLLVRDRKYIKLWCKLNKNWIQAIEEYWYTGAGHWRKEMDIAARLIRQVIAHRDDIDVLEQAPLDSSADPK